MFDHFCKHPAFTPLSLLDIGARRGLRTPWDHLSPGMVHVYGFDADKEECDRLNADKVGHETFLPYALWDCDTTMPFYLTHEGGCSSLLKPNRKVIDQFAYSPHWDVEKEFKLDTTTLDSVCKKHKITPDFMKLDTQGSELAIIQGGEGILDDVLGIEVEVEFQKMYEDQAVFSDVDQCLTSQGFALFDIQKHWFRRKTQTPLLKSNVTGMRGQIIFADALYFREPDYLTDRSPAASWLKLAVIYSLYGYFDTAIALLERSESPFDKKEVHCLIKAIIAFSSYPAWQVALLRNPVAGRVGKLLLHLSHFFMLYFKSQAWGEEMNVELGRYRYYLRKEKNFRRFFAK